MANEPKLKQLQKVALDIGNRMDALIQKKIDKRGPTPHDKANWASEVPHPCKRFLVYARTRWRERKPKTVDLQFRLDEGLFQEEVVEDLLKKSGFRITLQQLSTSWDEYQLRGKVDGFIQVGDNGTKWPHEITSVQPWYWANTASIEAMKNHPKHWIRKKPRQLNLYLLLENHEGGFLIVKTFGKRPRILPMLLDFELAELDIQTCAEVNKHVEAGTLPDRIEYSSDVCGLCDFDHICTPLEFVKNLTTIDPADYAALLRYCELQEAVDEQKALGKKLVGDKKKPGRYYGMNAIHEDIEISTKTWDTKTLKLPPKLRAELNAKYQKAIKAQRTSINYIGGDEDSSDG